MKKEGKIVVRFGRSDPDGISYYCFQEDKTYYSGYFDIIEIELSIEEWKKLKSQLKTHSC